MFQFTILPLLYLILSNTKLIRADNTASVGTTLKFYISHLSQLQSFLTPSGSKQFSTVVRLNQGRGWKQYVFRNLLPGVLFAKKAYTGEVRKGFPARGSVYTYRSLVKKETQNCQPFALWSVLRSFLVPFLHTNLQYPSVGVSKYVASQTENKITILHDTFYLRRIGFLEWLNRMQSLEFIAG